MGQSARSPSAPPVREVVISQSLLSKAVPDSTAESLDESDGSDDENEGSSDEFIDDSNDESDGEDDDEDDDDEDDDDDDSDSESDEDDNDDDDEDESDSQEEESLSDDDDDDAYERMKDDEDFDNAFSQMMVESKTPAAAARSPAKPTDLTIPINLTEKAPQVVPGTGGESSGLQFTLLTRKQRKTVCFQAPFFFPLFVCTSSRLVALLLTKATGACCANE